MRRYVYIFLITMAMVNVVAQENKEYSITSLPVINLTFSAEPINFDEIINEIMENVKATKGYRVVEMDELAKTLSALKIDSGSILLDSDLQKIQKKTTINYIIYNIVSIDEKDAVTIYTKIVDSQGEIKTYSKTQTGMRNVMNRFKWTVNEALKGIAKETKIRLNVETEEEAEKEMTSSMTKKSVVGLATTITGGTLLVGGLSLLIYDMYYIDVVRKYKKDCLNFKVSYEEYEKVYETNIALMTGGLALIGVGVVTTAIGLPIMITSFNKKVEVSFDLQLGRQSTFACLTSFDIRY